MKTFVCGICKSDNVTADAYAEWEVETQKWELSGTFMKGGYCGDCEGETTLEEKTL